MKKTGVKMLQGKKWQIEGDLILKEEKVYVPKEEGLKAEIIWLHHDILVVGHGEKWKITELVTRNYWQPGITKDIEKYIEECDLYQRIKNRTEVTTGKLKLSKVLERL